MSGLNGQTLQNRYHVDAFIGRGGMAEVYRVWDSQRAVFLAMKLLRDDLAEDRVFLNRFQREGQTLEQMQHPHIVRFYGLEQEGRNAFMLMDFVEGESLRSRIFDTDGPLSLSQVRAIMKPICSALHFAHNQGLIHCDMKPGNVMIDNTGRVLVADFGIARATDTATATMVGMGTPAFMAPEQIRGEDPMPHTDVYALGVLLYEMLTGGERPFTGERATVSGSTSEKVRWEQLNTEPPSPRGFNPGLPRAVEAVIMKCLNKEPGERYTNTMDLFKALDDALGDADVELVYPAKYDPVPGAPLPTLTSEAEPELQSEPQPRRGRLWLGIGIVVIGLCIVGGLIALSLMRNQNNSGAEQQAALAATETIRAVQFEAATLEANIFATQTQTAAQSAANGQPAQPDNNTIPADDTAQQTQIAVDSANATAAVEANATQQAANMLDAAIKEVTNSRPMSTDTIMELLALVRQTPPDYGPFTDALYHDPNDNQLESFCVTDDSGEEADIRNFVLEVEVDVPFGETVSAWDAGIIFRGVSANDQYRLLLHSAGFWQFDNWQGIATLLGSRNLANLNTGAGESNTITFVANWAQGFLWVNDTYVTELDIEGRILAGSTCLATGIAGGHEVSGEATNYHDFTVWVLPD